jgi:hypothetical protein
MAKEFRLADLESLLQTVEECGSNAAELYKLKAIDLSSSLTALLFRYSTLFIFAVLCVVFAGISLSIYIGECLGSLYAGFLVFAIALGLLFVLVLKFGVTFIERKITDEVISKLRDL